MEQLSIYIRPQIDLLGQTFDGRLISRNDDVNWPAKTCDLTPLDFFLWGAIKKK